MFVPPKLGSIQEVLWIHGSDGSVRRADIEWIKGYLEKNASMLRSLGYVKRKKQPINPIPVPVYTKPATASIPVPTGKNQKPDWQNAPHNPKAGENIMPATVPLPKSAGPRPAWDNAPVNPNAGKPMTVVAGPVFEIKK